MKKHTTVQIIWNNAQFVPEKEGIWHRGTDKGEIYNSTIRKGNKRLVVSFYVYGGMDGEDFKEAWQASVYEGYQSIHHINCFEAKDVNDAEDQALIWAESTGNVF